MFVPAMHIQSSLPVVNSFCRIGNVSALWLPTHLAQVNTSGQVTTYKDVISGVEMIPTATGIGPTLSTNSTGKQVLSFVAASKNGLQTNNRTLLQPFDGDDTDCAMFVAINISATGYAFSICASATALNGFVYGAAAPSGDGYVHGGTSSKIAIAHSAGYRLFGGQNVGTAATFYRDSVATTTSGALDAASMTITNARLGCAPNTAGGTSASFSTMTCGPVVLGKPPWDWVALFALVNSLGWGTS